MIGLVAFYLLAGRRAALLGLLVWLPHPVAHLAAHLVARLAAGVDVAR